MLDTKYIGRRNPLILAIHRPLSRKSTAFIAVFLSSRLIYKPLDSP